jgi:hypothetical protein
MGYKSHIFKYPGFSTRSAGLLKARRAQIRGVSVVVEITTKRSLRSGGGRYSTTTILFGNESGIHRRPRASRVIFRTEEFLAGIG